jgi:hypothetical protein
MYLVSSRTRQHFDLPKGIVSLFICLSFRLQFFQLFSAFDEDV